jgi:hypothetical protein
MKKIIVFVLMLSLSAASFSQQAPGIKTDYLKKSKNQKTVAVIMAGGGVLLVFAAVFIIPKEEVVSGSSQSSFFSGYTIETNGFKVAAGIAGTLCMLGSIPLFIAAHKNEKKAMSLSFKNETAPQLKNNSFTNRPVPSLTLKISL